MMKMMNNINDNNMSENNYNLSDDIYNLPEFDAKVNSEAIIKVIGVGGGGNNAINHMYNQGIKNVTFVVCNTDNQALVHSPVPNKLLIGPKTTKGLGAGNMPELAREAAEESIAEISETFNDHTKMVFITAGMGGGTGTGAAPIVAKVAKEKGLLTIGIVTIPFVFEGQKKILKALDGANEMSKHVDALLIINNERLTEIYSDLDFQNAFGKADDTLSIAARSISDIINSPGKINLDFNDVHTTLKDGGAAIISSGYGEGENRVTKAIQDALNSPLLKNRDIYSSKRLLYNIYFSRESSTPFAMSEVAELTNFSNNFDLDVDVIWGVSFDETLGDKIKITILASGFDITIQDDNPTKKGAVKFTSKKTKGDARQRLIEEYGSEKIDEIQKSKDSARFVILTPEQMDDDAVVEKLEKLPAFNRDKKLADEIRLGEKNNETAEKEDYMPISESPKMSQTDVKTEKNSSLEITFD